MKSTISKNMEMVDSDDDVPLAKVMAKKISLDLHNESSSDSYETPEEDNFTVSPQEEIKFDLFEYEWPRNRSGNYFVIESELGKFLEIEDIKGIDKRNLTSDEWEYITSTLGHKLESFKPLKAIKIEDAYQYMAEVSPEKFLMYNKLVHNQENEALVKKQEAQRIHVIKGKIPNIMKRSLREAVRYNSQLNRERIEERRAYFDLQTQIIHLPQKKRKYDTIYKPKKSMYPVALIPGQYQDYFKRYTEDELKYLPLNSITAKKINLTNQTAIKGKNEQTKYVNNDKRDEDEKTVKDDEVENESDQKATDKDPFCGICTKGPEMNKRGLPEKLIHCSQCQNSGHPSCLDMNRNLVKVIQGYPWQCMECKICTECLAPHDEEAMMFCDNCDRGYHSYCVGLKEIPKGRWVCEKCGKCCSCLSRRPVPEGESGRWKNEVTKPTDGTEAEFLQIHCHDCSRLFRKGSFCPVCLKVYRTEEDHINPMVMCDQCDRWVHTDCDGIDEPRYKELSKDHNAKYTCVLCRGEREERMDSFHKSNR